MSSSTESATRGPPASRRTRSPKRCPITDARRDNAVERCRHLEGGGALAQLPFALLVLRDRARVHERADRLLDEKRVASGASDDLVAELVGPPVERRVDDPRPLLIGERLQDELTEIRADGTRLGRSRTGALREEQQDRNARGARGYEPEKLQGR